MSSPLQKLLSSRGGGVGGGGGRPLLFTLIGVGGLFLLFYYAQLNNRPGHLHWKKEYGYLNGPGVSASDALLLRRLGLLHMQRWPDDPAYTLSNSSETYDPSMGQSQVLRGYLGEEMRGGFFVECGALDGETRSNTLYFERVLGWNGLLIEADPDNFKLIRAKGRVRAWASNTCLSTNKFPQVVSFSQNSNQGRISSGHSAGWVESGYVDVQCYPLESYMRWLNRTRIDYLSLDVEGLELEILKTIDFSFLDIRTLSVEFIHDKEGKDAIELFMRDKGYDVLTQVTHPNWLANDFIFVKQKSKNNKYQHVNI